MKLINIYDLKTNLSKYIPYLVKGEKLTLCRRNKPIAIISGIKQQDIKSKRILGVDKGRFELESDFFERLPNSILDAFNKPS